jgi:hypothetical protein
VGEWKIRRKEERQPFFEKGDLKTMGLSALVGLFVVIAVVSFLVLILGVRFKKIQKVSSQPVPIPVVGIPTPTSVCDFKTKTGVVGRQIYVVSVQKSVEDGGHMFLPMRGCPDFLVVDMTFPIEKVKDQETLHTKLYLPKKGVRDVEVSMWKVVFHRPCVSVPDMDPSLGWEGIWKEVAPVLDEYFRSQK